MVSSRGPPGTNTSAGATASGDLLDGTIDPVDGEAPPDETFMEDAPDSPSTSAGRADPFTLVPPNSTVSAAAGVEEPALDYYYDTPQPPAAAG
jgi:hypothetical protein